jgi:hypothetical protein
VSLDVDGERVERIRKLVPRTRDVRRRALDGELSVVGDLRSGLVESWDEAGDDERLRLRAAFCEPTLYEQDVEALLHAPIVELRASVTTGITYFISA